MNIPPGPQLRAQLEEARKKAQILKVRLSLTVSLPEAWQRCFRLPELHQQMGLPEERYTFLGHPMGLTQVDSALFGQALTFWEWPLRWEQEKGFVLERLGAQMALRYLSWSFQFQTQGGSSKPETALETNIEICLRYGLSPKSPKELLSELKRYLQDLVQTLEHPQPPPGLNFSALYDAPSIQAGLSAFYEGLPQAQAYRLGMHPRALEKTTGMPREQILRGLVELSLRAHLQPRWYVHEPDGTVASELSPENWPSHKLSPKYNTHYDLQPDYHLSLWFSPPQASPFPYSPFPADQPYRIAQFWLWEGQSHELQLHWPGAYRLASPSLPGHLHLRVGAKGAAELPITIEKQLEDREWPILAAGGKLKLHCLSQPGALFYCYTPYESQGPMTGAQAICSSALAALMPESRPPVPWKIGQQVFLMVGLLSPQTPCKTLFRALLEPVIAEFSGLKQPLGENTQLLLFPWTETALRAGLKILAQLQLWNQHMSPDRHLRLALALHRGGALLSPDPLQLGVSGPGLRLSLQLLEQAQSHELLFSRTLMQDPGFQQILSQTPGIELHEMHRFLRGPTQEPDRIYRLVLSQ